MSDPKILLQKLNEKTLADIERRFAQIDRFLGPGDTFRFTCDRSGKCCRDRFENPILLSPYDVHRLRNNLKIPSRQFAAKFGCKILGSESQLPMMLLDFEQQGKNHNKCPFLMSYGCKVYQDRPLVCRLYPVGRAVDSEMNSFFFLTRVADYCKLGTGKEYTIEEWLEAAQVEPYFEWNDRFNSLYMRMDHEKYKSLELPSKAAFGDILYHPDTLSETLPEELRGETGFSDDAPLEIGYRMAKIFVERLAK